MLAYIVRRTLIAAFTVLIISFISYVIIHLPEGDYADFVAIQTYRLTGRHVPPEELEAIRELVGLNRPLMVQYWDWLSSIIFHGDFGPSWSGGGLLPDGGRTPIADILAERLPFTIALNALIAIIVWVVALPIGIYSAVRQHSIGDYTFTFIGFTGIAVPDFILGLVLMYVAFTLFDHRVGGLFSGHYVVAPWSVGRVIDLIQHLIIPTIVIGTAGTAGLIRIMRNNLLDELRKPYVATARAKGQAAWKTIAKYPVRVALNPFISGIGGTLPGLIGSSVIVSIVLSLPTLGPVLLTALRQADAPLAGTIIMLFAALSVVGTLVSDLMLVVIDPRIKLTGRS